MGWKTGMHPVIGPIDLPPYTSLGLVRVMGIVVLPLDKLNMSIASVYVSHWTVL